MVEPAAMPLPVLLNWFGYILGSLGVVLLIWSMLKQGVSLLGLVSLIIGFLLLVLADLIVYSIGTDQTLMRDIGRPYVLP